MKSLFFISCIYTCFFLLSCSGSKEFVNEKPQEGKCLLVGAVIIENNGIENKYETILENIHLVIVGKYMESGEEKTEGYKVKTDENGYYMLQNVPPGAYVLKGFEVDVGFDTRLFVTSRWDGNRQIYYPGTTNIIDHTVRVWPEASEGPIIDLEISYFMIDQAMRVADNRFNVLKDRSGALSGVTYTMKNPVEYYKSKYPQWEWFKTK